MPVPPGLTPSTVALAFADRVGRLGRRWDDVDQYLAYFCSTTAPLLDPDDPLLRHYVEHDLVDGQVRLSPHHLVADATDTFFGSTPWEQVEVPIRFLHAEWSVGRATPPGYPPDAVARYAPHTLSTVAVDGVDHAGSIMSPAGAQATGALVREALA